jgi:hypothetical protein
MKLMEIPRPGYIALAASLLLVTSHSVGAQAPPAPAAYWTMDAITDGVVADQTGAHNAKVPSLIGMKDVKTGEYLADFAPKTENGVNDKAIALEQAQQGYLSVETPTGFHFENGLTISAWVKIKNANAQMVLLSSAEDIPNPKGGWCLFYSYGSVHFKAVDFIGNPLMVSSPKSSVAADAWVHIAAVADATTLRLYLNGIEAASQPFTGPVKMAAETPLVIGNHATIAGWRHSECPAFGGLMDEVKIFETALSNSDVKSESERVMTSASESFPSK